jgi:DNA-binding transcriptional regulator YbjK
MLIFTIYKKIMSNKELQEKRMKGYFIQATKEIIMAEGTKALSVRSIAEKAGYSFATMYGYFKDSKDLIFVCVQDFANECEQYVADRVSGEKQGKDKIKKIVKAYVEYMVQYPGVFELFYIEKNTSNGTTTASTDQVITLLDELCEKEMEYCISQGTFRAGEAIELMASLRNSIIGLLLFYVNRQYPKTYRDFSVSVNRQLDRLLG